MPSPSVFLRVVVSGAAKAQADLRRRRLEFGRNVGRGIIKATAYTLRLAQQIVPVDQGHLRGSGFARHSGSGLKTIGRAGYEAEYALWVHEDLGARHGEEFNRYYAKQIASGALQPWNGKVFHKRGPNQQAKFLEKPVRENRKEIVKIVIDEAKKGIR